MEWDGDRIQASVTTLTDDLGAEYDVRVDFEQDVEENPMNPFPKDGYTDFQIRPRSQRVTITICPKGSIVNMSEFTLKAEK